MMVIMYYKSELWHHKLSCNAELLFSFFALSFMIKIVSNDVSGEPSKTPEYLALPTHAGFGVGVGVGYRSLASRGIHMENKLIIDVQ